MKLIKALIPKFVKGWIFKAMKPWVYFGVYFRDARRYARYSSVFSNREKRENLRSLIAIDYHRIEKGLALANPRFAFGKAVVENLISLMDRYLTLYEADWTILDAIASLQSYFDRFSTAEILEKPRKRFDLLKSQLSPEQQERSQDAIGTFCLEGHRKTLDFNFSDFYCSRHSVREFSEDPVSIELIEESIVLAMRAPSVCNRQPWKVYCVSEAETIQQLCQIQGGSRGFATEINKLLVVGVDLSEFYLVGERNECWVDGGIFLQSLLISLHAKGLGACPLNWCVSTSVDDQARKIISIKGGHALIALVAVGGLKDTTKFARSERRPVEDVLTHV